MADTTYGELAKRYNTTIAVIRQAQYDFLQNEGFLPNGDECHTLTEWLNRTLKAQPKQQATEPFQKGDLGYGL